ncbi:hypothetical protein CORC01_08566, partial [Colletotrichum orchidophilum]
CTGDAELQCRRLPCLTSLVTLTTRPCPASITNVSLHHLAGSTENNRLLDAEATWPSKSGYDLGPVRILYASLVSLPGPISTHNTLLVKSRDTQRTAGPGRLPESFAHFSIM